MGGGGGGKGARKLAAELWRLWLADHRVPGAAALLSFDRLEYCDCEHSMEGATKWETACSRIASHIFLFGGIKLVKHNKLTASSRIQAELMHAYLRIQELQLKQRSFEKEVEGLLRKLDKKTSSQMRQHQKSLAVIVDLKNDLRMQRKHSESLEILNSNLIDELADVKLSAKQLEKYYEEEKRGTELMEQVCKELAHNIAEHKAKVEALKMESINITKEAEEERKVLQIAGVWLEECVHMKLADAKLAVLSNYSQMNKLIADLEAFLMSRSTDSLDMRKDDLFRQVDNYPINIEDLKDIYLPKIQTGSSGVNLKEQDLSYSLEGSARKCKETVRNGSPNRQIMSLWSVEQSLKKKNKKIPSSSKLWGSSKPSNNSIRLSNSLDTTSPKRNSCEGRPGLVIRNMVNPHIARETKGSIEWPRHIRKKSFRAKDFHAKMEGQKAQLLSFLRKKTK